MHYSQIFDNLYEAVSEISDEETKEEVEEAVENLEKMYDEDVNPSLAPADQIIKLESMKMGAKGLAELDSISKKLNDGRNQIYQEEVENLEYINWIAEGLFEKYVELNGLENAFLTRAKIEKSLDIKGNKYFADADSLLENSEIGRLTEE